MGAWDAYIGGTASGDPNYMNNVFTHTKNPFKDPGDGTHAYNVYKILYDAVADGLTEDDYSTTDWETSKNKLNSGDIATMVLGSWAVSQIQSAGDNAKDVATCRSRFPSRASSTPPPLLTTRTASTRTPPPPTRKRP